MLKYIPCLGIILAWLPWSWGVPRIFFCRFCKISKAEFSENPLAIGKIRTSQDFEEVLYVIEEDDIPNYKGIKSSSVLNSLKNYHVTQGLPPCLAHDIFEGVANYDVTLILSKLVGIQII